MSNVSSYHTPLSTTPARHAPGNHTSTTPFHAGSSLHHALPRALPPRRLSTINTPSGLSSPPAISPEAGDSFIYRARAPKHHDEHGHAEDAAQGIRRLSTSPTKALSHLFGGPGAVGHFPKKRSSSERVRDPQEQAGAEAGALDLEMRRPRHEKAATEPYPSLGELGSSLDHDDEDEDEHGGAQFGGLLNKAWPSKSQAAATLGAKATQTLKSKWKTVIGPGTFTAPSRSDLLGSSASTSTPPPGLPYSYSQKELDAPNATAMPVSTSHHTPFAHNGRHSLDYGFGSYIPPSGAPGFTGGSSWSHHRDKDGSKSKSDEWSGTRLLGRREGTFVVLDEYAADAVSLRDV